MYKIYLIPVYAVKVVSGGADSKVMVWDITTGEKMMQFTAHREYREGQEINIAITAMTFDTTQRRLVTAARNGAIKVWNFNNGACLRVLEKGSSANIEVTGIVWPLQYIITSGWSQLLVCYMDADDDDETVSWQKFHQEDIMAMAYNEPSTIATASFDGDIIIWSLDAYRPVMRFNAGQSTDAQLCGGTQVRYDIRSTDEKIEQHDTDDQGKSSVSTNEQEDKTSSTLSEVPDQEPGKVNCCIQGQPNSKYYEDVEDNSLAKLRRMAIRRRTIIDSLTKRLSSQKNTYTKPRIGRYDQHRRQSEAVNGSCHNHTLYYTNVLLFLKARQNTKNTATLVSAGVGGWVYFWSVHQKGGLQGMFNAAHYAEQDITALATDPENTKLITGDDGGYIKVWNIVSYCCSASNTDNYMSQIQLVKTFVFLRLEPIVRRLIKDQRRHGDPLISANPNTTHKVPQLLTSFKAHFSTITKLDYIPDGELVLSSSQDGSIRMFLITGAFIGIFGHPETWKNCPYKGAQQHTKQESTTSKLNMTFSRLRSQVYSKNLPPDIRRVASATTLKVMYDGVSPLAALIKTVIMAAPMLIKSIKDRHQAEQDGEETSESSATDLAMLKRPSLGVDFKVARKHRPRPSIPKLRFCANHVRSNLYMKCFMCVPFYISNWGLAIIKVETTHDSLFCLNYTS